MLNVFISIATNGANFDEMINKRDSILDALKKEFEVCAYEFNVIESLFPDYKQGESNPIEFLGRSISTMKDADIAIFPISMDASRGCKIEYVVAKTYCIPVLYYFFGTGGVCFIRGRDSLPIKGDLYDVQ